jgi:MFS family permease
MLFTLYGVTYAMIDGSQVAYVADLATSEVRATSLGAFQTVTGITMLGANLFAGMLWHFFGATSVFVCIAAFSLLAGMLLMTLKYKPNN